MYKRTCLINYVYSRKILAEEETADHRDKLFPSVLPPLGSTRLGAGIVTAVGGREVPAARTEVALTCFHTACDTALVDIILFTTFLVPHDNNIQAQDAFWEKKAREPRHQTPKVKGQGDRKSLKILKDLVLLSGQI